MSKLDKPGYPLPAGELGEDEIVCQLVFLPDRPEYWQAFVAAYHYMTTWRAWERDTDKRGKDAAANWRAAFELTIGCWRMACLQDLQDNIEAIRILLEQKKDCCDDNIVYGPGDESDTDIVPDVGDPPDEYGETEVEDWDDWKEHVCFNGNAYVDYLVGVSMDINEAVALSIVTVGLLAAGLVLLGFVGLLLPVAYVLAAGIASGIIAGATTLTFSDTAEDIEDAREDIVCALLTGRSLAGAVEDALSSGTDWDLFFQFIDYDSATAILYEGGHEGEFISAETLDTCTCECHHMRMSDLGDGAEIIYQHSVGAEFEIKVQAGGGLAGFQVADVVFNNSGVFCGPMKTIDTISVDDALLFSRIITYDQDAVQISDYGGGGAACNQNINVLLDDTVAEIWFQRNPPAAGCAVASSVITMTYHDAV